MPHVSRWLALFTTGLITACAGTPTHSQPAPTPSVAAEDPDPPARVARLNFLQESVSFQPAGTEDWVAAVLNRPLTTGDKLWSDADARAEVHAGSAVFRMARNTGFSFLNLDDSHVQIRFTAGTLNVHLRQLDEHDSYEIDTPNLSASLLRPGDYRFEVNDDGDRTIVKVLTGSVEITGESQAFTVQPQQEIVFTGTTHLTSDVQSLGAPDAFDSWCLERNRREDQVQAARYVSPEVVGYEDLDQYGTWRSVPDYGYVWTPTTVTVGWAPYRYGHWVWMSPWGWTWVDDAPWGFAPFHYGRWALVAGSWCWVPGPPRVRPVYAPALVAWVGGPRFSASISVGSGVAWLLVMSSQGRPPPMLV